MNAEFLESFITTYAERTSFSGILRVREKGELVYRKDCGLANREKNVPFSENSMFTFYSMTKPFCAIGLMKLWDKGLLSLEDHPKKYIPEMENYHKDLTIRKMLWHIGGVPDFLQSGLFKDYRKEKLYSDLRALEKLPHKEPGKENFYANINYTVAALIIEKLSGQAFGEYMKKEVFEPLSMTAVIDEENLFIENRVAGYEMKDGSVVPAKRSLSYMLGGGDMVGTEDDALKLMYLVRDKLLLSDDAWDEILTPNSVNLMGLGCNLTPWHGRPSVTHNGGHTGFRTFHKYLFDEEIDIIILSNSGWGNARPDISEAVYTAFFGEAAEEKQIEMDKGYIK